MPRHVPIARGRIAHAAAPFVEGKPQRAEPRETSSEPRFPRTFPRFFTFSLRFLMIFSYFLLISIDFPSFSKPHMPPRPPLGADLVDAPQLAGLGPHDALVQRAMDLEGVVRPAGTLLVGLEATELQVRVLPPAAARKARPLKLETIRISFEKPQKASNILDPRGKKRS